MVKLNDFEYFNKSLEIFLQGIGYKVKGKEKILPPSPFTLPPSSGQTLIELLIAIGIAVIVLSSMTIAVTSALSNASYSKNQSLATQYAQEGIELVRNEKLSDYQTFSSLSGRYCLAPSCSSDISTCSKVTAPTNCSVNVNNQFIRQVDIQVGGKCVSSTQATVSVLWSDGKCSSGTYCHNVSVVSCFSNANIIQGP